MIARALRAVKKLGFFYLVFGLGFIAGCIYEAVLLVSWGVLR
ncbi:MAG TPA: hypothetical protein VFH89_14415 [Sphingomicrobium sp.]|nr:hypothetical protein [Sphingomicrobium sp.]